MGRSEPEFEIELLSDTNPADPAAGTEVVRIQSPRWTLALAGTAALVAVGVLALTGSRPQPEAAAPPLPPTTEPEPIIIPEIVDAAAEELALLDTPLQAVITSPRADGATLITVSDSGEVAIEALPALVSYAFDRSGRWVAGVSLGTLSSRPQTLWAGPVGGTMEPVAVGISSFAWHDSRPGELGWTDRNLGRLTLASFESVRSSERLDIAPRGRLTGWGEWGFAIETSSGDFATTILQPDGATLDAVSGRFRGRLPTGQLLFGGGSAEPLLYTPGTQTSAMVPWLGPDDDVWSLATSESNGMTVALATRNGNLAKPMVGEVLLIGGEREQTVGRLSGHTAVAFADDGSMLFVDQPIEERSRPGLITVIDSERDIRAAPVPDVLPGQEWVVALALL